MFQSLNRSKCTVGLCFFCFINFYCAFFVCNEERTIQPHTSTIKRIEQTHAIIITLFVLFFIQCFNLFIDLIIGISCLCIKLLDKCWIYRLSVLFSVLVFCIHTEYFQFKVSSEFLGLFELSSKSNMKNVRTEFFLIFKFCSMSSF